jgi:hypothetical protein
VLPAAGLTELVVAFLCVFLEDRLFTLSAVVWLSTTLVLYRFGLWFLDWHRPCGCLGHLNDLLHLSPETADKMMKILLLYLLLGSYVALFWLWRSQKRSPTGRVPRLLGIACPKVTTERQAIIN